MGDNPTRRKGSGAFLSVGLGNKTEIVLSGIASGLSSFDVDEVEDSENTPGGGIVDAMQPLGYKQGSGSIQVKENSITGPLFHGKNGRRFKITYGKLGNGSGMPKKEMECIATITHNVPQRGTRGYNIAFQNDGLITRGTFA